MTLQKGHLHFSPVLLLIFSFCLNAQAQMIKLTPFAIGFSKPVDISNSGMQGDTRLFITEKDGRIKIAQNDGNVLSTPFLDIDAKVNSSANERGLLGLCFHPKYEINGYFYVHYSNNNGHSTIARYRVSTSNPNIADPTSEKIIILINQPYNNHNAGDLDFGPDGYLYIGMGDGGNGGDPGNRSQNPKNLLGKMLRLDVDTENEPYIIPPSNPYPNNNDTLPEIWAMGLRNPWRFSFDTLMNEIWIADVGQDKWEEINVASTYQSAINYGWRCYEGFERFNYSDCNDKTKFHNPISSYANIFDVGCSVTGGFVYRGLNHPSLYGKYIYTDFCTGIFWTLYRDVNGSVIYNQVADMDNMEFATFGLDISGELYVAGLANGTVFQIGSDPVNNTEESPNLLTSSISIKPNPALHYIDLTYRDEQYIDATWKVFTLSDIEMPIKVLTQTQYDTRIDISSLTSGVYILKNTVNSTVQKFVKI